MSMTDITDQQVISIIDNLRQLSTQVKEIDAELGTDISGPIAARNKLAAQFVEQYKDDANFKGFINTVLGKIREHFASDSANGSMELQVAVVTELDNQISKAFAETNKNYLQKLVDAQPQPEKKEVSDTRKVELWDERTKAVNLFKLQKEMLKYVSTTPVDLPSDIEEPSAKKGAAGPRGAQFTKTYQYYLNGKLQELTDSDGNKSLATLSNLVLSKWAKDLNWKTKDLRDYIVAQNGVTVNKEDNTADLPNDWNVTLPAPHQDKTLSATLVTQANVNEAPEPEEEDNDNSEDAFSGV